MVCKYGVKYSNHDQVALAWRRDLSSVVGVFSQYCEIYISLWILRYDNTLRILHCEQYYCSKRTINSEMYHSQRHTINDVNFTFWTIRCQFYVSLWLVQYIVKNTLLIMHFELFYVGNSPSYCEFYISSVDRNERRICSCKRPPLIKASTVDRRTSTTLPKLLYKGVPIKRPQMAFTESTRQKLLD